MNDTTADTARAAYLWLKGQFLEIEEAANEAGLDDVFVWELCDGRIVGADPRYRASVIVDRSVDPTPWQRQLMVWHDPRTVLADVAAKRDIIDGLTQAGTNWEQPVARRVVLRLAAALSHRPGWQEHWTPGDDDSVPDGSPDL